MQGLEPDFKGYWIANEQQIEMKLTNEQLTDTFAVLSGKQYHCNGNFKPHNKKNRLEEAST